VNIRIASRNAQMATEINRCPTRPEEVTKEEGNLREYDADDCQT
jgi:hypothetical protein